MKLLVVAALFGLCFGQNDPNTKHGRTSIVHLFEWRWADVAAECERYLAPNGYAGVQISPPSESIVLTNPWHPWWQRYQPISYNLCSRSGTEAELRDMITRCNNVGVNIYVDAVINHMCGAGGGEGNHSSCGTYFNAKNKDFPSVPYSSWDFNDFKCKTGNGEVENYKDIFQVRDCRLVSLLDLALEKDYVREKVAEYLNKLIDIGVAGFRVDACKHMWPGDLSNVFGRLKSLNTTWFSPDTKPFIYQEVIDLGGEAIKASEYFELGRVTEFKYGAKLGKVIRKWDGEKLSFLKSWGEGWGFMPSDKAVVFLDNHDNQRGHGAGGASVLTFWDSRIRMTGWDLPTMQMDPLSQYLSNKTPPVETTGNMVIFRNVVSDQPLANWWDNGNSQISFSRGSKGFIVINNNNWELNETLNTGLPGGTYCDVISGDKIDSSCTGKKISVDSDGRATFHISHTEEDPFIAIHAESKL
ncbi:Alpha-amylase 1 [Triplophysa tibetana]|uniref:Alpha-amylase n=1 Tax=Triplophysa tibetana TaxID=1572043 RepID=A0A5A9NQW5_9TELE|nr:Alpha-amylase 1 [Triplophysa tibetana]